MSGARRIAVELLVLAAVGIGLWAIEDAANDAIQGEQRTLRDAQINACKNRKKTLGFIARNAKQQDYLGQLQRIRDARPDDCEELIERRVKEARDGQDP